jgi:NAD dependent epimerase/dehydratase family enzyme
MSKTAQSPQRPPQHFISIPESLWKRLEGESDLIFLVAGRRIAPERLGQIALEVALAK